MIALAAKLHDVGKTAIPDEILNKPGPLDDDEWEFMRRHTVIGERIILAAPSLAPTAGLVRSSHERFDGTGYPDALGGERDPARRQHHRGLRRLRRDGLQAALSRRDVAGRRARRATPLRRHAVRSAGRRGVLRGCGRERYRGTRGLAGGLAAAIVPGTALAARAALVTDRRQAEAFAALFAGAAIGVRAAVVRVLRRARAGAEQGPQPTADRVHARDIRSQVAASCSAKKRATYTAKTAKKTTVSVSDIVTPAICWSASGSSPQRPGPST